MTSTAPGQPPSRADHIGSLLRPKLLRDALRLHTAGEFSEAALRSVQDAAVRDAVHAQEECGLEVITDGEFRRASYWERFVRLTRGLVVKEAVLKFRDEHGHESDFSAPYVAGKVSRSAPITADEYGFLKSTTARTAKITMPAPSTMHFYRFSDYGDPRAYRDPSEFFADLGAIYRQEIADLVADGCRYVQLDEVAIAILCDPAARERVRAQQFDPDRLIDLYIDAINLAVAQAPPDVKVGVHVCRGNYKGMYLSEGGYDSVAERFFGNTRVSHFLLEFDTPRAGGFAPLRYVPRDKGIVLGLVSSKTPQLEPIDALRRRVDEAQRYADAGRLALSPQCGFASTMGGNPVSEADQWAKLRLCVDAARAIWG